MERRAPITLSSSDVNDLAKKLHNGELKWHNFYDITDPTIYNWYKIQKKFKFSETPKQLPLLFFDIEVDAEPAIFPDPDKAKWAINSISLYSNIENKLILFFIPPKGDQRTFSQWDKAIKDFYFKTEKEFPKYKIDNIELETIMCRNDKELLQKFFTTMFNFRAVALAGYNSALFDIPYVFNRARQLFNNSFENIVSQFGIVKKFGNQYEIPDIAFVDMLILYKPQSAGGMAFGKAQVSYELDYIAKTEIGVGKLEYEGNLIELYQKDPVRFFVYNMYDTILLHLLNEKLQHINNLYGLSQFANAPMSKALVGRSLLYQFNKTFDYWDNDKAILCKLYNEEIVAVHERQ